ncbi:MAG: pitrilysin family protein [Candidatus Kapabacteria bacterium]|nr:pitrilysin family protein [Candidatus Kapabacteria bacterium]
MKNKITDSHIDSSGFVKYDKITLENGLTVINEEVKSVQSFAIGIAIFTGSVNDLNTKEGSAHFLEHAIFKRTKGMNSKQIASAFESLGGYTNAYTTKDLTCFYARALSSQFKEITSLLTKIVFQPAFNSSDLDKERLVIAEEIKSYLDDPEELIFDYGDRMLFGKHPLGNPIVGTQKSLNNITLDDLYEMQRREYLSNKTVISIAGNVPSNIAADLLNQCCGNIQFPDINTTNIPIKQTIMQDQRKKKPFQQSHILMGRKIKGMDSGERYLWSMLNVIFGDGMSCRLNQNIREKFGYAYSIYSTIQLYKDIGAFYIYAGVDSSKLDETEKLIKQEIAKLLDKGITDTELSRAKVQLKSSIIMSLESLSARMQTLAKNELYLGIREEASATIAKVDSINKKNIYDMIQENFTEDNWGTVAFL